MPITTIQALPAVAARMKYLMENNTAYDEMLAWKIDGCVSVCERECVCLFAYLVLVLPCTQGA